VGYLEEQKKKHPMHGEPWTPLLDEKLKRLWLEYSKNYSEKEVISKLMKHFERNNGSIKARLIKLGLLEIQNKHITKPESTLDEFDEDGYDKMGFDEDGYDKMGFDEDGYDRNGWNDHVRSLPLDVLISQKRSSYFYKLREKKRAVSKKFLNNEIRWTGYYYSKNRNPDKYTNDSLTQNIIKNKNEINGIFPAQFISKRMYRYLIDNKLGSFDCVIPVGNHPENSEQLTGAVSIAHELSKLLKIDCFTDVLKKTLNIKARNILKPNKREFWSNNDLYVFSGSHEIKDKKILLVDDIITHDYTMTQCIYQLGYESPQDITVLCAGRTMK